nr:lipoprotein [Lysinibacillus timonensis]
MKKLFILVFIAVLILSACNPTTLTFREIENVPKSVQEKIDPKYKLQLINEGEEGSYLIFHSNGDVETAIETEGTTLIIKFNVEANPQDTVVKQHTYYYTTGPKLDTIDIFVNGQSTPIDMVTVGAVTQ